MYYELALFVVVSLLSKRRKNVHVYAGLINYSKAFDTVKHALLIELLLSFNTDTQDIKLLANLYWNHKATVTHNEEVSESINIKQGVVRDVSLI